MAELFTEVYNFLPLAHCINSKVMVCMKIIQMISTGVAKPWRLKLAIMNTSICLKTFQFSSAVSLKCILWYFPSDISLLMKVSIDFPVYSQVMHGGLFSEDNVTLDDIRKTERNRQPPESGQSHSHQILIRKYMYGAPISFSSMFPMFPYFKL